MPRKEQPDRFPLAQAALRYWDAPAVRAAGREEGAWITVDSEDEARSAPIDEGGRGMIPAFEDGLDQRAPWVRPTYGEED